MDNTQSQTDPSQTNNQQGQHRPLIIQPTAPSSSVNPTIPPPNQQPIQLPPQPQQQTVQESTPTLEPQQQMPQPTQVAQHPVSAGFYNEGVKENYEDEYNGDYSQTVDFSWSGPEFVMVEKSPRWFMGLIGSVVVLGGLIYLVTKDFISLATIVVAIMLLGGYSMRRPKNVTFSLDDRAIHIGSRSFLYEGYKHFTVNQEGNYVTINFAPLKRFSLPIGVCCQVGEEEEQVIDYLSSKLPYEQHRMDMFDSIIQRLHL